MCMVVPVVCVCAFGKGLYVCLCGVRICVCAFTCVHTMLWSPWREAMNALAGEEGLFLSEHLLRAVGKLLVGVRRGQECCASGKLICPAGPKIQLKERMREMRQKFGTEALLADFLGRNLCGGEGQ